MQRSNTPEADDTPSLHRKSKRARLYRIEYRFTGRYARNPEVWYTSKRYRSKEEALRAMEILQAKTHGYIEYRYPDDNPP